MSEAPRKEIPPPKGADDFEDLVLALYRAVWKDPNAKLHGRSGQAQDGVDLYGEDRFGGSGLNGVQCKQHGSATPVKDKDLVAELREEVEKAKSFQPPLQRFIFATTARRSATLQQEARDLTELHRQSSLFAVDVLGWEDLEDLLRRHSDVLAWYLDERAKVPGLQLDLGRLPIPGPHLFGREEELARLDAAWQDPAIHVIALVAFGGVGKSALVARWMDRMAADDWRGATRVLDWSFYSQGSKDQNTSAEPFIDHALRFFGDSDPKAGSLHDRGSRLASLIRKERSLLVLDGVEPLQYPPGRPEIEGRLKDPGLTSLLKGLAAGNPGLCVVTTREWIADLAGSPSTAPQIPLEVLEPDAAVALLRQLGVAGRESELVAAAEELQRHALTLTLLGNFLRRAHGGDVRKRQEIDLRRADKKQGGHAFRVIAAYARWLGEGPELAILRLLGLFDRPAEAAALKALRAVPPIPGFTEPLMDLSNEDWRLATATLRDHSLLAAADPREPETLDAHPLVRAFFAEELESRRPDAWQEGNRRLYEHLRQAVPELPDTLEAMQPLYAAVVHGCRAGRQQEAMDEVYWRRILRREEFFSTKKLGAFGSELTALAGFFDRPWAQPSARLTAAAQAFVLGQAAFRLRSLGCLAEAVEPMQAGLEAHIAQEDWKNASQGASNLSELTLTLGDVPLAVAFGEQSVELADRNSDAFRKVCSRTTWADALHQTGQWEESATAFRVAEAMQADWRLPRRRRGPRRGAGDRRARPDAPARMRRAPRMGAPLPGPGGSRRGAAACGAGAGVGQRDRVWAAGAGGGVVGGGAHTGIATAH